MVTRTPWPSVPGVMLDLAMTLTEHLCDGESGGDEKTILCRPLGILTQ